MSANTRNKTTAMMLLPPGWKNVLDVSYSVLYAEAKRHRTEFASGGEGDGQTRPKSPRDMVMSNLALFF